MQRNQQLILPRKLKKLPIQINWRGINLYVVNYYFKQSLNCHVYEALDSNKSFIPNSNYKPYPDIFIIELTEFFNHCLPQTLDLSDFGNDKNYPYKMIINSNLGPICAGEYNFELKLPSVEVITNGDIFTHAKITTVQSDKFIFRPNITQQQETKKVTDAAQSLQHSNTSEKNLKKRKANALNAGTQQTLHDGAQQNTTDRVEQHTLKKLKTSTTGAKVKYVSFEQLTLKLKTDKKTKPQQSLPGTNSEVPMSIDSSSSNSQSSHSLGLQSPRLIQQSHIKSSPKSDVKISPKLKSPKLNTPKLNTPKLNSPKLPVITQEMQITSGNKRLRGYLESLAQQNSGSLDIVQAMQEEKSEIEFANLFQNEPPRLHQITRMWQYLEAREKGTKNAVFECATGSGKANFFIYFQVITNEKTIIFVPRDNLIEQILERIYTLSPQTKAVHFKSSSNHKDYDGLIDQYDIFVMTYQTLDHVIDKIPFHRIAVVALDEAHNCLSKKKSTHIKQIISKGCCVTAYTATPGYLFRRDDGGCKDVYELLGFKNKNENPISPYNIKEGILNGSNCPVVSALVYPEKNIELDSFADSKEVSARDANKINKSYNRKMIADLYANTVDPVSNKPLRGQQAIGFTISVDHAKKLAETFNTTLDIEQIDPNQTQRKKYAETVRNEFLSQYPLIHNSYSNIQREKIEAVANEKYEKALKDFKIAEAVYAERRNTDKANKSDSNTEQQSDRVEKKADNLLANDQSKKSYKKDKVDCDAILKQYKQGGILALFGADILKEGFDHAKTSIVFNLRQTFSTTVKLQTSGRGTRLDPADKNKICYVFDFVWDKTKVAETKFFYHHINDKGFGRKQFELGDVARCRDAYRYTEITSIHIDHAAKSTIQWSSKPLVSAPVAVKRFSTKDPNRFDIKSIQSYSNDQIKLSSCMVVISQAIAQLKEKLAEFVMHMNSKIKSQSIPEEPRQMFMSDEDDLAFNAQDEKASASLTTSYLEDVVNAAQSGLKSIQQILFEKKNKPVKKKEVKSVIEQTIKLKRERVQVCVEEACRKIENIMQRYQNIFTTLNTNDLNDTNKSKYSFDKIKNTFDVLVRCLEDVQMLLDSESTKSPNQYKRIVPKIVSKRNKKGLKNSDKEEKDEEDLDILSTIVKELKQCPAALFDIVTSYSYRDISVSRIIKYIAEKNSQLLTQRDKKGNSLLHSMLSIEQTPAKTLPVVKCLIKYIPLTSRNLNHLSVIEMLLQKIALSGSEVQYWDMLCTFMNEKTDNIKSALAILDEMIVRNSDNKSVLNTMILLIELLPENEFPAFFEDWKQNHQFLQFTNTHTIIKSILENKLAKGILGSVKDDLSYSSNTVLHIAARSLSLVTIQTLLRAGVKFEFNDKGNTPLHEVILGANMLRQKTDIHNYVHTLIQYGVAVNLSNNDVLNEVRLPIASGLTALELLLKSGNLFYKQTRSAKLLMSPQTSKIPFNKDNFDNDNTILHTYINLLRFDINLRQMDYENFIDGLGLLLTQADSVGVSIINRDGDTAIHLLYKFFKQTSESLVEFKKSNEKDKFSGRSKNILQRNINKFENLLENFSYVMKACDNVLNQILGPVTENISSMNNRLGESVMSYKKIIKANLAEIENYENPAESYIQTLANDIESGMKSEDDSYSDMSDDEQPSEAQYSIKLRSQNLKKKGKAIPQTSAESKEEIGEDRSFRDSDEEYMDQSADGTLPDLDSFNENNLTTDATGFPKSQYPKIYDLTEDESIKAPVLPRPPVKSASSYPFKSFLVGQQTPANKSNGSQELKPEPMTDEIYIPKPVLELEFSGTPAMISSLGFFGSPANAQQLQTHTNNLPQAPQYDSEALIYS